MFDFKFQISNFKLIFLKLNIISAVILLTVLCLSCSIPNLEKPECIESREFVKRFYSYHFGNDLKPSLENLQKREIYLSKNLFEELKSKPETANDYFTQTDDYPKAFRVGSCEVIANDTTVFEVLLFWKTETRSEQRTIKVETVKENDKWLIEKIENKQ